MLFVGGSNLGRYFMLGPHNSGKAPHNSGKAPHNSGLWLVCEPCGRVVVVSNNRIVLSNHTKLLAGAVRARVYLKKQ